MKINVARVQQEIGGRQPFSFLTQAQLLCDEDLWIKGKISVNGDVVNNGRVLEVKGTIRGTAVQCCSRCLEEFCADIELCFNQSYQQQGAISPEDEEIYSYQGEEIDLAGLVLENLLLGEPLKAICSDNCRGLCPQCGVNLNQVDCFCGKNNINPKFAILQQLLGDK